MTSPTNTPRAARPPGLPPGAPQWRAGQHGQQEAGR
jgi:hypothetical protein